MGILVNSYSFNSGPFQLSGQLDVPESQKDLLPSLLLVPGMAQHDRNGNARGFPGFNEYYKQISWMVNMAKYNVFRYDKGGIGKSKGLSFPSDMVSAFKTMVNAARVDKSKVGLIVHDGGAAHVYRRWTELNRINPINQLILLGSGVNDLKLRDLFIPILIILEEDVAHKSIRAIKQYAIQKKLVAKVETIANADKNLFDTTKVKPNLQKAETCVIHANVEGILTNWLSNIP